VKKITTLAVSLLTAACMSAGALAADQPLEKVAPFPNSVVIFFTVDHPLFSFLTGIAYHHLAEC
jgi:hypothetical protein